MKFTDLFVRRPVFSASLSLLLLVIGLIAFDSLNIRQYPQMQANVIVVSTKYPGANAETVESFITTKIEDAIAGVDDIDYITSSSDAGESKVVINLVLNADVNSALEDVNSNLSYVIKKLPDAVDNPSVKKVDSDGMPAFVIGFSSEHKSSVQITDYLNRVIIPQVSTISGVGSVDIMGNRTYAMRLWLDPRKMAALGITTGDVRDALEDNNIQAQPGEVNRESQTLTINAKTDLMDAEEFNDLVLKTVSGQLVRFKDIGSAELGAASYDKTLILNGLNGVGISISVKSSANPLTVSSEIKKVFGTLKKQMPKDISMHYARDSSLYIASSIHEVVRTIIEAALFVFVVIFVFLGSWRSVLIPIVTIPLSLVGAFAFMYIMDYTINTLTLLAFVLAIGMVVDDAIVVLENIHRHIERGKSPLEGSLSGAREISFAVVAMTFTLAAVFAPIGFTTGFTSILFKEFAFTLAATVVISGFIALTLSPMMCSKIMSEEKAESRFAAFTMRFFSRLTERYRHGLTAVLQYKGSVIMVLVGVIVIGAIFFDPLQTQSTLAPNEDQGVVIGIGKSPTSSSLAYTQKYTSELIPLYNEIPEADSYAIINGHPGGESKALTFLGLTNWSERSVSAQEIQEDLMQKTSKIPGMQFMFFSPSSVPGSSSMYPVEMVIKTTGDYQELNAVATEIANQLEASPGIMRAQSDLKLNTPEMQININRSKAAQLGVNMSDINSALNLAFGSPDITSFVMEGKSYDVIPQVAAQFRNNPDALNNINVKTSSDALIPLSNLITISNIVSPSSLDHFQQQRAATISLVLAGNFSQREAIQLFEELAKDTLPNNMTYDFSGDTRQFMNAGSSMLQIFCFALLFIYLILSAQFESFRDPLIVMFTVPLSLAGALATIYMAGASLNIYTEIGLITLVGLISKHGILIVEFANQLQEKGRTPLQAVIESATVRLRPILMTTCAMVLGAFPLVLANGAGAVSRAQMGWVIMGGMTFGTILTLFVIPTMYVFIARDRSVV
jgi:multidrug efflux pump